VCRRESSSPDLSGQMTSGATGLGKTEAPSVSIFEFLVTLCIHFVLQDSGTVV
jgi:hypothetical protein